MRFKPGDVCSFVDEDGFYGVLKILRISQSEKSEPIYSITVYREIFDDFPDEEDIQILHPFIGHFPITEKYFLSSEPQHIFHKKVSRKELGGFNEWLKLWHKGKAGVFEVPIIECIKFISRSLMKEEPYLH